MCGEKFFFRRGSMLGFIYFKRMFQDCYFDEIKIKQTEVSLTKLVEFVSLCSKWKIFFISLMARIIWSWQCCRLLVGNIANGIASKNVFAFLTELGNFKQKYFWRQCHWQCCQTKVCSIVKSR